MNHRPCLLHLHCYGQQGTLKYPHTYCKELGTKLPVLWSGLCLLYCHGWDGKCLEILAKINILHKSKGK